VRAVPRPAALAALAVLAAGCGGPGSHDRPARPLPSLQSANCIQWRALERDRRIATVRALTRAVGGPTAVGGHGATLPDDRAYKLFQNVCRNRFAAHFLLYEMYNRAAAFESTAPPG
jgi:hypothetical protein